MSKSFKLIGAAAGLAAFILLNGIGKQVQAVMHLKLPGPVIGFALLAMAVILSKRYLPRATPTLNRTLDPTAGLLLKYMGLLFVPAGVGVITQWDVIRMQWPAIATAVLCSTVLGLAATGWVTQRCASRSERSKP